MRFNFRIKLRGYTFFTMLAKTQSLHGVNSKVVNDKLDRHYVFWDLEKCTLEQVKESLFSVQVKYCLSNIFIVSDFPKSYRAWCFSKVNFKTYLKILLDTAYLDYNFFYWCVYRGKSTLRIDQKKNRPKQKLLAVLESFPVEICDRFETVDYDTGCNKIGIFKKFDFDSSISEER